MATGDGVKLKTLVRCKPSPKDNPGNKVVKLQGNDVVLFNPQPHTDAKEHTFKVTGCFNGNASNNDVFESVAAPFINPTLEGHNVLLLALGQKGTGKNASLCGSIDDPNGIVPLFCQQLFSSLEAKYSNHHDYLVTVSYFQVSDNGITDILNPGEDHLQIKSHFKKGVFVNDLSEFVVCTYEELNKLFTEGNRTKQYLTEEGNSRHENSSIFKVVVDQKTNDGISLVSEVLFVIMAGIDQLGSRKSVSAIDEILSALTTQQSARAPYSKSNLTHVLQNHLSGNSMTIFLATISQFDKDYHETLKSLNIMKKANNVICKPLINKCDTAAMIAELRSDINNLREKIVGKGQNLVDTSDGKDLHKLDQLIKDLEYLKLQSWTEKQRLSKSFEKERWHNLANKGLLDFVLNPGKQDSKEVLEHLENLQKNKDEVMAEYKEKRTQVDSHKEKLQELITEYSKLTESGKAGEEESKKKVPEIHKLKEKLKQDNEDLKQLKLKLKDIQEKQKKEKQVLNSEMNYLHGKSDIKSRVEAQQRDQTLKDNRVLLAEEIDRVKIETEQQKAELKLKYSEGHQLSTEEMIQLEMTVLDLKAEKAVMALKIKMEQQEKSQLASDLSAMCKRHQEEMEVQQLQHFQTFRHYREIFEEQKTALDQQYRALLEDSIQDAVFLSSRNEELLEENQIFRQDLAEAKDQLSTAQPEQ